MIRPITSPQRGACAASQDAEAADSPTDLGVWARAMAGEL